MYSQGFAIGPDTEILNPVRTVHPVSVTLVSVYVVIFA